MDVIAQSGNVRGSVPAGRCAPGRVWIQEFAKRQRPEPAFAYRAKLSRIARTVISVRYAMSSRPISRVLSRGPNSTSLIE